MTTIDTLYETFDIYLREAEKYLKDKHYELAKKCYLQAAMQMLKIAKQNNGELQKAQYKRAKALIEKAEGLSVEKTSNENNVKKPDIAIKETKKVTIEEALKELNALIGLDNVKSQISEWVNQIKIFKIRQERGYKNPPITYHLVFLGNPGTGKTTVARIIAQIYKALGIISKGQLVEVDRGDLVAGYVGQTALKTKEVLKAAKGGVLFIDEAYTLGGGERSGNDFGKEAVDTILKAMEDYRDDLVVIVAGYTDLMLDFIKINPGLQSRFKTHIVFDDYCGSEMYDIFLKFCKDSQYVLDKETEEALQSYFRQLYLNRGSNFGNAREVRNIFENGIVRQSNRVARIDDPTDVDIATIKKCDLSIDWKLIEKE